MYSASFLYSEKLLHCTAEKGKERGKIQQETHREKKKRKCNCKVKILRKFGISYSSSILLLAEKRDGNIYSSEIGKKVNVFNAQPKK